MTSVLLKLLTAESTASPQQRKCNEVRERERSSLGRGGEERKHLRRRLNSHPDSVHHIVLAPACRVCSGKQPPLS